jgi:hypothetical protein
MTRPAPGAKPVTKPVTKPAPKPGVLTGAPKGARPGPAAAALRALAAVAALMIALSAAEAEAQILGLAFCGEAVPLNRTEVHEIVDQELLLLSEAKARVWLTLRRSARHLPVIDRALKEASVPSDFRFLPMALANLDPQFRSGNRRGLWRLTEAEAAGSGLVVDKSLDERLDPIASSAAAAARLAALKAAYGSWTLAAAAFIDQGAVNAALAEAEGERDYYRLYLPEALEKTMAQVLAGKVLYSSPELYGYTPARSWPVLASRRTRLEAPASLRELAAKSKLDYKTFRSMNPHLIADPAPAGAWLNIP